MDELKALMGDSFKDGMTLEDVSSFLKGKNFKDLSTGNYVDKSKFDSRVNELTQQLNDKTNELNSKLTDDEKQKQASANQLKEIERLKQMLKDNTISGNKNTVNGVMTSAREILGIDLNNQDFISFVDDITTDDSDKSTKIANYVSSVIKDAYEKGKKDALKDSMGDFGKGKGKSSTSEDDKIGQIGKRLAQSNSGNKTDDSFSYFK